MTDARDNEYHHPRALGSLTGALRLWQDVHAADLTAATHHVVFAFACPSESRAVCVAGFLRRRLACALTLVSESACSDRQAWHVHGSTRREVQSLAKLEAISSWLRGVASKQQVTLVRFALVADAA